MVKYKVLSTKKISPLLVEEAKEDNIEIIEHPFICVEPITTKEKVKQLTELANSGKEYIAFTSSNAVTSLEFLHECNTVYNNSAAWKIFCLEGKTKEAVLNSSIPKKNIIASAENAKALAHTIIECGVKDIIFFCGNKRRNDLPEILKIAGVTVHEAVVYETVETPAIMPNDIDGILFFSPSAVHSFFSVNKLGSKTVCFAIGKTTAGSIAEFTENKIITVEAPGQDKMIAALKFYFHNINCYE
jgi:uroporphyrinogen-III synthase